MAASSATAWRLLPLLSAAGNLQMAIDAWLLDQHRLGAAPALRFYTWSPIAISLGYHQRHYPPEWTALSWQNQPIDLVRRPSGGRAVLHQGDLTYAVITSGLPENRRQAYQQVCEFLIQGWRSLGVELHYGSAGQGYIHNPDCFGTATAADLIDNQGEKRIGSAQLWRDRCLLQHGSMRLGPDPQLFQQVFGSKPSPAQRSIAPIQTGIQTGIQTDKLNALINHVVDALIKSAIACFQAEFVVQPLTEAEWQAIQQLAETYRLVGV